jgi:hypothetical protein
MEKPTRYESIQASLDDEERELMNPETWDWDNPVEVMVAENPGAILPIRFTLEELARLEPVARAAGLTPHAFIKRAALEAMHAARP